MLPVPRNPFDMMRVGGDLFAPQYSAPTLEQSAASYHSAMEYREQAPALGGLVGAAIGALVVVKYVLP